MIYKFKQSTRIPDGVTPDQVMAEMDAVEAEFGKKTPELAADAVIARPEQYPALRSFGPESPDAAFRKAIRDGITYAMRCIVIVEEDKPEAKGEPEVRALFLVTDPDGDRVYEPIEAVAVNVDYRAQLIAELRRDARTFAAKMDNTLAEIERLINA
jgi:hypothetical protein